MIDIPELLDITFSNLDTKSLMACSVVSRFWSQLALPHLWREADMYDCDGMWPCSHKQDILSDNADLLLILYSLIEKYGRFLWHMKWPLQWMGAFVCAGRPFRLKILRIPIFTIRPPALPIQIESFLEDVPAKVFEDYWTDAIRGNPPIEYDKSLLIVRMLWHLILNSPGLQKVMFNYDWTHAPAFNFRHQGTGPNSSTVMVSPGGLFLKKVFENLPQLRHLKLHLQDDGAYFLMALASASGRSYTTKTVMKRVCPLSLELHSLDLQQFLSQENRPEVALWNLTNYNIRSLDVKKMRLEDMDTLMTIMPALEKLHVHAVPFTRVPENISSYFALESWTPILRHSSLKTMRLDLWVMTLLSSHVVWENLERFEAPNQRLLWGLALILERMPNVQHLEIACSLNERKPRASVIRKLQQREAAGIQGPLSIRTLVVYTRQNRAYSGMLTLLPRLPFLTRLELCVRRAPILDIIAQSCLELEHLKLDCEGTGHQELHKILVACSKLKTVRTTGMDLRAIDLIQKPITCLDLQELEVEIKGIPRLTAEQTRALRDFQFSSIVGLQKEFQKAHRRHQRSIEMERQVMAQLARLTKLKVLILSKKPYFQPIDPRRHSLALTLEAGFGLLESLQALHTFAFERTVHEMSLQELHWISSHWPNIVAVRGVVQTRFGQLSCYSPIPFPRSSRGRGRSTGRGCRRGIGRAV